MCSAERIAYMRVVAMAADERRRIAPPVTNWGSLSAELRQQGVITTRAEASARKVFIAKVTRMAWQVAAGFGILVTGLVTGRMSAGMPVRAAFALGMSDSTSGTQLAMT